MSEASDATIDVDDYGEMLALVNDTTLIYYKETGSYQGEYTAICADKDRMYIYQGSFGSCSGCDWLEDEDIYDSSNNIKRYKVNYKNALDYCQQSSPLYIVPFNGNRYWLKEVLKLIDVAVSDV